MKLRFGVERKNKNVNKVANQRPKAPAKAAIVLLSGALAAGAAACGGNKVEDAPKKDPTVVVEKEVDLESVTDLSERDALLAHMIKNNMRDTKAKITPIIDYPQGEVNLELDAEKAKNAGDQGTVDLTFITFVNKKKEEAPAKKGEPSGKEQLAEMGCDVGVAEMGTSDVTQIPIAVCYDLNSIQAICEAACVEKNPKSKEKKQNGEESEEEKKPKEKESKDEVMEFCINSCFGGALVNLFKTPEYLEAKLQYNGLLGNGHCDDDQWATVRVIVYEVDDEGNVATDNYGKPVVADVQTATILVGTEQGIDQEGCVRKGGGAKATFVPPPTAVAGKTGQK